MFCKNNYVLLTVPRSKKNIFFMNLYQECKENNLLTFPGGCDPGESDAGALVDGAVPLLGECRTLSRALAC